MAKKLPPFKPLFFKWRYRVMQELDGARLKVWIYLLWRSGEDDIVDCANSQIEEECDLGHCAVQQAKKWLKENGWLVYEKEAYKDASGKWISPLIRVQLGLALKSVQASKPVDGPRPGKAVTVKPVVPVHTLLGSDTSCLPVDTDSLTKDVRSMEAATAVDREIAAAAAAQPPNPGEKKLSGTENVLLIWYRYHGPKSLSRMKTENAAQVDRDAALVAPLVQELGRVKAVCLVHYVRNHEDPDSKTGFSWKKKCPNVPSLVKAWNNGHLAAQFEAEYQLSVLGKSYVCFETFPEDTDSPSSAVPLTDNITVDDLT